MSWYLEQIKEGYVVAQWIEKALIEVKNRHYSLPKLREALIEGLEIKIKKYQSWERHDSFLRKAGIEAEQNLKDLKAGKATNMYDRIRIPAHMKRKQVSSQNI